MFVSLFCFRSRIWILVLPRADDSSTHLDTVDDLLAVAVYVLMCADAASFNSVAFSWRGLLDAANGSGELRRDSNRHRLLRPPRLRSRQRSSSNDIRRFSCEIGVYPPSK